jgi:hypothetical protein
MSDEFHYSHLLPRKPPVTPKSEPTFKQCTRCNAGFVTSSRVKKRCDICQEIVDRASVTKSNLRAKQERALRKELDAR